MFDLTIAASNALQQCWISLIKARKAVLIGDPFQLSPFTREGNTMGGSQISMFERLIELYGDSRTRMLTVQYRSHATLMEFPSVKFYDGNLIHHSSVARKLLCDIPKIMSTDATTIPLLFFDTQADDFQEDVLSGEMAFSDSKSNSQEARLVIMHVRNLIKAGVEPKDIGVITPYVAQVIHWPLRI